MFSISIIENTGEAERIWRQFGPAANLYDDWDYRFLFYRYFNYPLRFYVGREDGEVVGLLPLQYNTDEKCLEFFSAAWSEDNHVFIRPGSEEHVPRFYEALKERAKLEDIVGDNRFLSLDFLENKYVIDLKGLGGVDDYLQRTFSAKTRSKFRKKMRDIEALDIVIRENHYEDLENLMELNRRTFGLESSFCRVFRPQIYRDLLRSRFEIVMLSAEIGGRTEGVSLGIKYGSRFVSMKNGVNKQAFENLGTFMTLKRIEKAIALKCEIFDAGLEDLGWKELWHLEKVPEYKFEAEQILR